MQSSVTPRPHLTHVINHDRMSGRASDVLARTPDPIVTLAHTDASSTSPRWFEAGMKQSEQIQALLRLPGMVREPVSHQGASARASQIASRKVHFEQLRRSAMSAGGDLMNKLMEIYEVETFDGPALKQELGAILDFPAAKLSAANKSRLLALMFRAGTDHLDADIIYQHCKALLNRPSSEFATSHKHVLIGQLLRHGQRHLGKDLLQKLQVAVLSVPHELLEKHAKLDLLTLAFQFGAEHLDRKDIEGHLGVLLSLPDFKMRKADLSKVSAVDMLRTGGGRDILKLGLIGNFLQSCAARLNAASLHDFSIILLDLPEKEYSPANKFYLVRALHGAGTPTLAFKDLAKRALITLDLPDDKFSSNEKFQLIIDLFQATDLFATAKSIYSLDPHDLSASDKTRLLDFLFQGKFSKLNQVSHANVGAELIIAKTNPDEPAGLRHALLNAFGKAISHLMPSFTINSETGELLGPFPQSAHGSSVASRENKEKLRND